jgi:hypothetical protein
VCLCVAMWDVGTQAQQQAEEAEATVTKLEKEVARLQATLDQQHAQVCYKCNIYMMCYIYINDLRCD